MKKCVEIDPLKRPNIQEIINDLKYFGFLKFKNNFKNFYQNPFFTNNLENGSIEQLFLINSHFTFFCKFIYCIKILENKENAFEKFEVIIKNYNTSYFINILKKKYFNFEKENLINDNEFFSQVFHSILNESFLI